MVKCDTAKLAVRKIRKKNALVTFFIDATAENGRYVQCE